MDLISRELEMMMINEDDSPAARQRASSRQKVDDSIARILANSQVQDSAEHTCSHMPLKEVSISSTRTSKRLQRASKSGD